MTSLGLFKTKPLREELLQIKSHAIHYEIHGPEDPIGRIVFVMGLLSSMGGWSEFVHYFSARYQCLVLDNRGYGLSTPGSFERYTTSGMAQDVISIVNHVQWQDFHLVGISMGGMISQHIALQIPSRILTLTLLATCAKHKTPKENPLVAVQVIKPQPSVDAKIKNLISLLCSDESWLDQYDPKYPEYRDNRERMYRTIEYRIQKIPAPPFKTLFGQGLAVKTHNISPDQLKEIGKLKVLIMTGTNDMMIDPACSDFIAKHTGGKFVVLNGRGHGLTLESENEVIKEMELLFTDRSETLTDLVE